MRKIVLNNVADFQALNARLVGTSAVRAQAVESLKRLNPHVDFASVATGTVIVLPDTPEFRSEVAVSVPGEIFHELRDAIVADLDSSVEQGDAVTNEAAAERAALEAILRADGLQRLSDADQRLKVAIASAITVVSRDRQAAESAERLWTFRAEIIEELKSLEPLFE